MALPAGYYDYSDEDDLDGFGDDDLDQKPSEPKIILSAEDEEKLKKERFQSDLMLAIINGNNDIVELALKNKDFNVNEPLQSTWVPLMLAASVGNLHATRLLIEHGANVNYDNDKYTILMCACNYNISSAPSEDIFEIIKLLVENGANTKAINRRRMTPLMFACSSGNLSAVKYLLPLSDKFAVDNQGWTALFWAVNDGKTEVVQYLLGQEYSDRDVDVRGNTVLDYATAKGYTDITELLPSYKLKDNLSTPLSTTNFYKEFCEDLQPNTHLKLFNDIFSILYGMRCEQLASKFVNVTLRDFLCLTDEELKELEIDMPFQRYRILAGLFRFHRYPYKPKSLPVVKQNQDFSNIDALRSIICAIRQFIAMEASIEFVLKHWEDKNNLSKNELIAFESNISTLKTKILQLKNNAVALNNKAKFWNELNRPADLITANTKKSISSFKKKLFIFSVVILLSYGTVKMLKA